MLSMGLSFQITLSNVYCHNIENMHRHKVKSIKIKLKINERIQDFQIMIVVRPKSLFKINTAEETCRTRRNKAYFLSFFNLTSQMTIYGQ